MEDNELKSIQEAITRQATNNYPQIYIQDLQSGRVFEYGKNCHDRLVISEDGRSLHYENLQDGDGSNCGDYRFYYEKPKIETEMDKMHEWDLDHYARNVENKSLDKLAEFEDFIEEQGFESLEELKKCFEIWNSEDDNGFLKDTDNRKLFLYRFAKNLFRYEKEENQALKDRWQKLKEYVVSRWADLPEVWQKMEELEKEIRNV